jgi:hypothetical protein
VILRLREIPLGGAAPIESAFAEGSVLPVPADPVIISAD